MSVALASGDVVTLQTSSPTFTVLGTSATFAAVSLDAKACSNTCNATDSNSPSVDQCMTFTTGTVLGPLTAVTVLALSYDGLSFAPLPKGTPITLGSYVAFEATAAGKTVAFQTGPSGAVYTNNVVQLVPPAFTGGSSAISYQVWVLVDPAAAQDSKNAGKYGWFSGTIANGSSPYANMPAANYATPYLIQSVGKSANKGDNAFMAAGDFGYAGCSAALFAYTELNDTIPSKDLDAYSFTFLAPNGAPAPGLCNPPCPGTEVCDTVSLTCYAAGVCTPACNTAAGWRCNTSNACAPGPTAACPAPCATGFACQFTADGTVGGVGATCVLAGPCGAGCPAGQKCSGGACVAEGRSTTFWLLVALAVVVALLVGLGALVAVVVVLRRRSAAEAAAAKPAAKAKTPAAKAEGKAKAGGTPAA